MAKIYLIEANYYDSGTQTLRCCTGTGFTTGPTETPANTTYIPRVDNPGNYERSMFTSNALSGGSSVGFGEVVLLNSDGELDSYKTKGFAGQQIVIRYGDEDGAYPSDFPIIMQGVQMEPNFTFTEIVLRLKDRMEELNVPIQPTKYAGNNSLPNGLEGVADIKGQPKPLLWGPGLNITPVCVNTSKLTFQVNAGAVNAISAVRDMGVALVAGTAHANSTALQAATVAVGTYDTCLSEGYFRLGSTPAGQITCDAQQGAAAANRTCAQIARQIALLKLTAADLVEQSFIALDAAYAHVCGIYIKDEMTVKAALDMLTSPAVWYEFDNWGKFKIQLLTAPSGTAITTLSESNSLTLERVSIQDQTKGTPAYKVTLGCDQNHTVQQASDLAGRVTEINRIWYKDEFRKESYTDSSVLTAYPTSPELKYDTPIQTAANALTEATRIQGMLGTARDVLKAKIDFSTIAYPAGGFWDDESVSDMSLAVRNHTASIYQNYAYVVGGYTLYGSGSALTMRLDLDNPTGAWDDAGVTDLPYGRTFHAAVIYDGFLYVIGGGMEPTGAATASVIRLDLSNPAGAWDDAGVTDLPAVRKLHGSVIFGTYLYVFGGDVGDPGVSSASVIRLDLSNPTGAWDDAGVTDLPAAVQKALPAVYGDYVYINGATYGAGFLRLDLTNPSGAWDDAGVTNLPYGLGYFAPVVKNNYLYLIGGFDADGVTEAVIRLDLSNPTGAWETSTISNLPTARMNTVALLYAGNIYLIGGYTTEVQPNTYMLRTNDNPQDFSKLWDLGRVVNLDINRFDYSSGKLMKIIGMAPNYKENKMTLTLWG